jgi:hypothetical protein
MEKQLDLSIIIVSWNSEKWLQICLQSIFDQTSDISFEVIVIDNNSQDKSVQIALNSFTGVKVIENADNKGFAQAVNQGMEVAQGRYICLLNPDTKLVDRAMEQMVAYMDEYSQIGILGPHLMNEDETTQPSVRRFPRLSDQLRIVLKLHHAFPDSRAMRKYLWRDFNYRVEQQVDQVMGAVFMIRREVMNQIGIFDEHFFLWFEEVEYCKRMVDRTDYVTFYYPEAHVIHYGGDSFDKVDMPTKQKWYLKSVRYYFRRQKKYFSYLVLLFFSPLSRFLARVGQRVAKNKVKKHKDSRKRK